MPICLDSEGAQVRTGDFASDSFFVEEQSIITVHKEEILGGSHHFNFYPLNITSCEPNLGKRDLYPTISQKGHIYKTRLKMNLLSYSDGKKSIFEIANLINIPLELVNKEISILKEKGLIST